jgi:four helix bundle protein
LTLQCPKGGKGEGEKGRERMEKIVSFRGLKVYEAAREAAKGVFEFSKGFPIEEKYALTTQIRNSSRSVCGCIAEAWRKRRYPAAFCAKLNDAEAEAEETRAWLDSALDCGYADETVHRQLDRSYDRVLGQLVNMINHPDQWVLPGCARKDEK